MRLLAYPTAAMAITVTKNLVSATVFLLPAFAQQVETLVRSQRYCSVRSKTQSPASGAIRR
jgi:hypothetical protein